MQANREELVERVMDAIQFADDPHNGGLVFSWAQVETGVRAAIAELTQAPAEPSDALREALEKLLTILTRSETDGFTPDIEQELIDLRPALTNALSRPAEPAAASARSSGGE